MASVLTFGCKLNTYEGELIKKKVEQHKIEGDVVIFNTCAVTKEAEKEAVKKIRKLKREKPNVRIAVTGCAAQINSAIFSKMPEVEFVFGNQEKMQDEAYKIMKGIEVKPNITKQDSKRHEDKIFEQERQMFNAVNEEKVFVNDILSVKETAGHLADVVTDFEGQSRAFVQIQNGCNHRCTFCIIPFARGNSRSVPFGVITEEVKKLVSNGYKEVVLTGVDITDYGKDLIGDVTLGKMIKRLLKLVPELARLRLSSIDVAEIDDDIYDLIQNEPRFMPYFHISLQSGDDLILKRMKRRHTRNDVIDFVKKVRSIRPGAAFGADIISGFPTEEEHNFLNSYNLIEEAGISFCHIFSFSAHEGTPASKMPQVKREVIKQRTAKLIEKGKQELAKLLNEMVGKEMNVLIESDGNVRCENFAQGFIQNFSELKKGDIVKAKAIGVENEKLIFII